MPLPNIAVPAHPNVPNSPGVPPVLRAFQQAADVTVLLVADAALIAQAIQGPQWGIFDQTGAPVLIGDSVVGVDFRREWRISDYPVERGSFASYNKVSTPADVRVTFTQGGSIQARNAFLAAVEAAAASLYLFDVATPEFTYANMDVTHFDYRREARSGATLLIVDVWLQEVRVAPQPQFTSTKQPSGADPTNGGTVQPAPLTAPSLADTPPAPPPLSAIS